MRLSVLAVALAATVAVPAVQAGEGMWVPQQLPEIAGPLAKAGLELPPEQLADLTGALYEVEHGLPPGARLDQYRIPLTVSEESA